MTNSTTHSIENQLLQLATSVIIFLEAAPVKVDEAGVEAVGLDILLVAELPWVGVTTELTALDVFPDVVEVVSNATLLVPSKTTLAEIIGLVANTIATLLLIMVHCVVTTGLLWNVIVEVPEVTSHSVLLLVTFGTDDTTGEVIVVVNDELNFG
jgi:electron transfer flavoprotein alpha subunit